MSRKTNDLAEALSEDWLVEVIEYSDPYCTWCWGSEPMLRKIREVYGNQVKITFKMGGLVEDIANFYDPLNRIGGEGMFEQVAEHWKDASSRHGMPVDVRVFQDLREEFRSTYPANIACEAAQMQNQELADKFLRRMREASAAERRAIHRVEVQVELAKEAGLDTKKFLQALESGEAKEAFYKDLKECRELGITGFPTFAVKNKKGEEIFLVGYQPFRAFEKAFEKLEPRLRKRKPAPSPQNILGFVKKYGKIAAKEASEVFDIPLEEAQQLLSKLETEGSVVRTAAGNGFFWIAVKKSGVT